MRCSRVYVWSAGVFFVGALGVQAEPDWASMPCTTHAEYQAVDEDGNGTFSTTVPVKMRGVILNRPDDMLNTTAGADPYMGGYWQEYIQATDAGDFGGTALWMGQNIGRIKGNHPAGSYIDAEWQAEVNRLSHDPATGRAFRPGDLVEVRARAPGLFNRGKTNINETHSKNPAADFDVVLIQPNYVLPAPTVVQLADLKNASDQFIFDPARATGNERYQATAVRINNVSFTSTAAWGPGAELTIQDGSGRTFPVLLGRGAGFTLYAPPAGTFSIVGILDQEDKVPDDGFTAGYRLWVMDYDENQQFVLYRYVRPDFDRDGDVDADDFSHLKSCATGPTVPQTDPGCGNADLDSDADVDQDDFGILQRCWTGADGLADPLCDR